MPAPPASPTADQAPLQPAANAISSHSVPKLGSLRKALPIVGSINTSHGIDQSAPPDGTDSVPPEAASTAPQPDTSARAGTSTKPGWAAPSKLQAMFRRRSSGPASAKGKSGELITELINNLAFYPGHCI